MTTVRLYTPFQEPWWLDAAAPGQWDAVQVERGGQLQAYLPFVIGERGGARSLGQPLLTQSLGPWISDTGAGYTSTLSREMILYKELIDGLPEHDVFKQHFATQVTNWLPFYWEGFEQTTRYTYTLDMRQSLEQIHAGMDKRNRKQLRRAQESLIAETSDDLETFLRLNDKTFERQGIATPYSHDFVFRLDEAARINARRWIVLARDKWTGEAHAGIYMIASGDRVYSLMSGADPTLRDQNGGIVARWKAIEVAHNADVSTLDFQGSMLKTVERRNRNYGSCQVPYFSIHRSNGVLEAYEKKRRMRRAPLVAAWRLKEAALKPFR